MKSTKSKILVLLQLAILGSLLYAGGRFMEQLEKEQAEQAEFDRKEREEERKRLQEKRNRSRLERPIETGVAPIP